MGWKEERYNAGYEPAKHPTTITKIVIMGNSQPITCGVMVNSLPARLLNIPKNAQATNTDIIAAIKVIIMDSVRNCITRFLRAEPKTLRTPTSLARLDERAVE